MLSLLLILCADAPLRIVGDLRVKQHRIARLRAENAPTGAALLWRFDKKRLDGGRVGDALWIVGPPGEHAIEVLAIRLKDGVTQADEATATLVIEGDAAPAPKPDGKPSPRAALGRLRMGSAGCTATVIGPQRADGRWDVLSAAHCVPAGLKKATFTLPDGTALALTLSIKEASSDLAWFTTDEKRDGLPFALLALKVPEAGTVVWHAGFGVDRPGNLEKGRVTAGEDSTRQVRFDLNVSSGDSGGGIFRENTGELVAAVCCTKGIGRLAPMYGGSSVRAAEIRPPSFSRLLHPMLDLAAFDWEGRKR